MSVVGFDLGNESCIVGVARQRGIDVVLNEESKRETPAIVCFGDKQRFIGTAGAANSTMNPNNSISQIKRLLGRKFADPELQRDLQSFPFLVSEGPDGFPLVQARYLGEEHAFTPTQLLAMVLSNLKAIAEDNLKSAVVDCCIGIPVYFTDLQRRSVLDAATIAGLRPLRLFHETTATALAYGIYKTDLPENDQLNVAFVDVGHASMQVSIVGYKKGRLKMLSHAYDRSLGGRDFDEALFKHFAAKFKEEYKVDVYQNARACIRLRVACEKLKKMLSANPEAPMNIECLMDEKDVRGFIKRDEFEQISAPVLERVKGPLEKALAEAGLTTESVHFVEVVGSGSRVPAIIRIITEFFGKEPRRTMNASECVARGCALQCAILSPTFKVREFQVNEGFPFSIALSWKPDSQNNEPQQTVVFPKGNPIPSVKALTFYRSNTFAVDVLNVKTEDSQETQKISTYTIGPFQSSKGEKAKLKVKVRLNIHAIVSLESATMLEEEEVEVPVSATSEVPKDANKMETDVTDVNMQEPKGTTDTAEGVTENGAQDSEEKPASMDTDAKTELAKKKVKKTNVPVVELVYGAMGAAELEKAVEKEYEMALQDRVMEETKEKKNAVEAYVYDMRNKLYEKYSDYVTSEDKEALMAKLQEVEDWLYEDGEDETKGVYVAKLEELKKVGGPIEARYREWEERGPAIEQLSYCIHSFREAALSSDTKFDHIDILEKQKVVNECSGSETWLLEKKQQQDALPKHADPALLVSDLKKKAEALDRFCKTIMTKPKPAPKPQTPPPAETSSPEAQTPEQQPDGATEASEPASEGGAWEQPAAEQMDTDEPDPSLA
ncbi:Heat shock 70 kDa protein 4L [Hordeum vulgare]|uniref:Heat shock 70 kDa protein 14 n=1 Tax=Hordeum vulgare subsp. vulgare TaxID=112509 RepID=A0A8I6W517_HORVV|nr:heat shock 70 kDa protein 15-like [Hordeum vulgare subsp. vulgare]KAE8772619.1 Heat shock 70 kDa protein 4L [Hordeum vulgare]